MRAIPFLFLPFSITVVPYAALAGSPGLTVAVFDVEASGVELKNEASSRLGDYVAAKLAATGQFRIIPRDQIKQRLRSERRESYKDCYDTSCQIEIGKEVAAQKSMQTQVLAIGSGCTVALTLFDLRQAATERSATAKSGCDEDSIVQAIDGIVSRLGHQLATANVEAAAVETTPAPTATVSTGREPVESTTSPPAKPRSPKAERELNMNRSEWSTFEGIAGSIVNTVSEIGSDPETVWGGGFMYGAMTVKWRYVFWCPIEVGLGGGSGAGFLLAATRAGLPIYLGARGAHQLRFGTGFGVGFMGGYKGATPLITPTAHYVYQTSGRALVGAGVRALFPVGGDCPECDGQLPVAVLLSVLVGRASAL